MKLFNQLICQSDQILLIATFQEGNNWVSLFSGDDN